MNRIDVDAVNALRVLAADEVQKANSGHPGLPLGAAPAAYAVWALSKRTMLPRASSPNDTG